MVFSELIAGLKDLLTILRTLGAQQTWLTRTILASSF